MIVDDIAHNLDVDTKVLVDKDVTEATDLRPRNLGMRRGHVVGKVVAASPMI